MEFAMTASRTLFTFDYFEGFPWLEMFQTKYGFLQELRTVQNLQTQKRREDLRDASHTHRGSDDDCSHGGLIDWTSRSVV